MNKLNLLPDSYIFKMKLHKLLKIAMAITAIAIFIIILIVLGLDLTIRYTNERIRIIEDKCNEHKFEESEEIVARLKEINKPDLSNLQGLYLENKKSSQYLKIIKENSPYGFTLKEIYVDNIASKIVCKGEVSNKDDIVLFIQNLSELNIFKAIELLEMQKIEQDFTRTIISIEVKHS